MAQGLIGLMYMLVQGVQADDVQAYMWLNLAAAAETDPYLRDMVADARETVAARLSPAQRAEAREMLRNWRPRIAARTKGELGRSEPRSSHAERSPSRSLRVMEVQQGLAGMGYDPGPVDGVIGSRTRTAIRAFQADAGLPVDGQVSDQLIAALSDLGASGRSAAAHTVPQTLGARAQAQKPGTMPRSAGSTARAPALRSARMARSSPINTWWRTAPKCASGRRVRKRWRAP